MTHIVVLTGAGVSAESGIPTFRDSNGLWENHKVEDVATPHGWLTDPKTVWRFYQQRRQSMIDIKPNASHFALAKLEGDLLQNGHDFMLITQNIDGLHLAAGSQNVVEMHGALRRLRCQKCKHIIEGFEYLDEALLPCDECGWFTMRPDVVWFEEMPKEPERFLKAMDACTHFASVGTSGEVYPAAGFIQQAHKQSALIYYANKESLPHHLTLMGGVVEFQGVATEEVPKLCEQICLDVG